MNSTEFRFICLALRPDDGREALLMAGNMISDYRIDWEELYERAYLHSVRPQLAQLINAVNSPLVPEHFTVRLNDAYCNNIAEQLSFVAEFLRIRQALYDEGITVLPFKGFWLASQMYGNIGDRESVDVDLFTDPNDLERIKQIMEGMDYTPESYFSPYNLEEIKQKFGEYNFDRYEDGVRKFHIEFQWRISSPVYGLGIKLRDLESQIVTGRFEHIEISVFTPSATLLLAVLHHGGKDSFSELKQVYDIARILINCKNIDWDWVTSMARKYHAGDLIPISVMLASDLLGTGIPGELEDSAASFRIRWLVKNRLHFLSESRFSPETSWHKLNNWLFRIGSRRGIKIKIQLTWYIGRLLIKRLLAKKW